MRAHPTIIYLQVILRRAGNYFYAARNPLQSGSRFLPSLESSDAGVVGLNRIFDPSSATRSRSNRGKSKSNFFVPDSGKAGIEPDHRRWRIRLTSPQG